MAVDYTFERPSPATVVDHEGIIRNCKIDEARFQGARRVENLLDSPHDFTTWVSSGAMSIDANGVITSPGVGTSADYVQISGVGKSYIIGDMMALCIRLKGNGSVDLQGRSSGKSWAGGFLSADLTEEYKDYAIVAPIDQSLEVGEVRIRIVCAATTTATSITVDPSFPGQIEAVNGQSNQAPSEYVSNGAGDDHGCGKNVDGVKYFDYKNGNTVDANGVVTEAKGSAIPGIAYLNEAGATNEITDSIPNATYWMEASETPGPETRVITENDAIAPDGLQTASKVIVSADFDLQRIYKTLGALASGIFSAYVKAGEINYVQLLATPSASFHGPMFDLTTGEIINNPAVNVGIDEFADGWWRVWCEIPENEVHTSVPWIAMSENGTDVSFTGNGVDGIYVWGVQFEENASAPSSYIPTSGAAASRAADTLSYTGVNVHEDFVAGCDVTPALEVPVSDTRMFWSDDSRGTQYEVFTEGAITPIHAKRLGGTAARIAFSSLIQGQRTKSAILGENVGANAVGRIATDGLMVADNAFDDAVFDHSNLSKYDIGNYNGASVFPCLYHAFQLFDQPLTDEQLTYLSKPGNNPKGCS